MVEGGRRGWRNRGGIDLNSTVSVLDLICSTITLFNFICWCQEGTVFVNRLSRLDVTPLQNFSPRSVVGDGNCFYRSLSLGLYGTQVMHESLRFRTAVQLLLNRDTYDVDSDVFILKNEPVFTPEYRELVRLVLTDGNDAELVHVFALSAAISLTIQSYCCPETYMGASLHPHTMEIPACDGLREFDSHVDTLAGKSGW